MSRRSEVRSYELDSQRRLMDCRAFATPKGLRSRRRVTALTRIGERSDAVLRTAMPGNDRGESWLASMLQDRLDHVGVVVDAELIGHGEQQRVVPRRWPCLS